MSKDTQWPLFPQETPEAIHGMPPSNNDLPEPDFDVDEDEIKLDQDCPNCGKHYDDIDYEYQICHICNHDNNK